MGTGGSSSSRSHMKKMKKRMKKKKNETRKNEIEVMNEARENEVEGNEAGEDEVEDEDTAVEQDEHELDEENNNKNKNKKNRIVWSKSEEKVILKGLVEYKNKNKDIPLNQGELFDSISNHLHGGQTFEQFQFKIRRLKGKFKENAKKELNSGEPLTFNNAHDKVCYDLSKKYWTLEIVSPSTNGNIGNGSGGGGGGVTRIGKKRQANNELVPSCLDDVLDKKESLIRLLGSDKTEELEKKWRLLSIESAELQKKMATLEQHSADVVIEALTSSV